MHIEESAAAKKFGLAVGFLLSYVLFTTMLFLLFILLKDTPWPYPKIMVLTGSIVLLGMIIRRLLK